MAGQSKMSVKIVVQRDADAGVIPRELQDVGIFRAIHPDLAHMYRVDTTLAQCFSRGGCQALIEEQARHATRSVLRRSSSTVARGVAQSLLKILDFKEWIFGENRIPIRVGGQEFLAHTGR